MRKAILLSLLFFISYQLSAQITLGTSPYLQNFDGIGTALPDGITVRTGATAAALGTATTYTNTPGATTAWTNTSGTFKNFASATIGLSSATAVQTAATDRALGIRQVAASDASVAFAFQIANTTDKSAFKLTFDLQSLDAGSPRVTTWRVDYGLGATPSTFLPATTTGTLTTGGTSAGKNTITADFGNALDGNDGPVWIRIAAVGATTGSGNRTSTAIDNFSLSFSAGGGTGTPPTGPVTDVTPPVNTAGYPKVTDLTTTSLSLLTNINEAGTSYYVLIPSTGGIAPTTATQVIAGTDGAGDPALKSGSVSNVANTDAPISITGLTAATYYNIYVVSGDAVSPSNLQTTPSVITVSTIGAPLVNAPVIISQYYEGASVNKWIELTNLSTSPINTASPQLKLALYNISGDAGVINITGAPSQIVSLNVIIPALGSVLIGNTGNGTEVTYLSSTSAAQNSNAVINFNGNDGVALLDASNNIIDAFGQGVNAKDVSYVRNITVTAPSPAFILDDWTVVTLPVVQNAIDDDDLNRLGVHFPPNLPACAAPATAASALTFSNITTNSISLNFTASPDANEYLVIRSLNPTLSTLPADGTVYNKGTVLGGGTVAGRIVTNTFTDADLNSATKYYYFVFALNNVSCTGGPKYLTSAYATSNQTTKTLAPCATPGSQPTAFTVTSSNYNFIQGSYALADGADQYLVVMSTNNTLSAAPVNQTVYNVGDIIGGGTVIKRGTGNTFIRSGLAQNTTYYFFIYALNTNCSGGPLYLSANPLKGTQKTGILDVNNLNFYYGNLHSHSSYSDGNKDDTNKKPEDDYAFAKNSMKMDFLGISEHNHTQAGMSLANWQPGIDAAKKATTSTFLALHGMEWGVISGGGHVIVYGIDSLIGWETGENQIFVPKSTYTGTTGLFRIINRHGLNAVATLAHPNTTDFNNISATYDLSADSAIVGTALESGPAFSTNLTYSDPASSMSYISYYNRLLARGYHLGASIDHDNHNLTFGRHTRARLVVLAPALTENDLLDAIKKMRFYASEDSAAKVTFTINKLPVGSIFTNAGAPVISVNTATTSAVTSIKLLYGVPGSGINPTEVTTSTSGTLSFTGSGQANLTTGYYYADIVEADGSRIITSPIWYTRDDSFVKKTQTITFGPTRSAIYGDPELDAGATSDNTDINIKYTSSDPTIATVENNKIQILKAGVVTITASQEGSALFSAAVSKQQVLTIAPKPIAVVAVAKQKLAGDADPALTYTSGQLLGTDAFSGTLSRTTGETPGNYTITQGSLAINANYAINYTSAIFRIIPKPAGTLTTSTTQVCINGTPPVVTFTAISGTAPFTFTYTLNGSTKTISTSTNTATVNVSSTATGTFTYTLLNVSDPNSNQAQTGSVTVNVNALPVIQIISNKGNSVSKGDAVILTATGGSQYSWTGSDIQSGQNSSTLNIRPKQSGNYKVTVTNASGCSLDETIAITVIDDYKLDAASVITPNGDGINDRFIIKNIDYYPNNTLKIFDKAGRILYTKKSYTNDWDGTVNGSALAEGTYYYILDMGPGLGNFKGFINVIRD